MNLAHAASLDSWARWGGEHALPLLLTIFLTVLSVIAALWHLFGKHGQALAIRVGGWGQRLLRQPSVQGLRRRYPGGWQFFRERFSRDGYLGLHLTVGLLVTLVALLQ